MKNTETMSFIEDREGSLIEIEYWEILHNTPKNVVRILTTPVPMEVAEKIKTLPLKQAMQVANAFYRNELFNFRSKE